MEGLLQYIYCFELELDTIFVRLHNWSMNVEKELDSRNTELSELVLPSVLELVDIMPRCFVNFTEDTNT